MTIEPSTDDSTSIDITATGSPGVGRPCRHDSTRVDGMLDDRCLNCGLDGHWHDGHRHDEVHPDCKVLIRLSCLDARSLALSEDQA